MHPSRRPWFLLAILLATSARPVAAQTSVAVTAEARVQSRTSLSVSADVLRFDVVDPAVPATAAVEFSAGIRAAAGVETLLVVEPLTAVQGPGGAADVEVLLRFDGVGSGITTGELGVARAPAARWTGSGLHTGRLVFRLTSRVPGAYSLPVRFVLSAP